MKTNAVIYARFSPRPNADESESCERQAEVCREYLAKREYREASYFEDRDISGDDADRPGIWQAIESLKRGWVLVVRWRSRLAREVYLSEVIRRAVEAKGARIEAAEENNGDSPQDKLIRGILAEFAEYEKKMIALRTKHAMLRHQKNGRRMGLHPPYGWTVDPENAKRLVVDDAEQEVIATMRQMRAGGKSYRAIATELDLLGIPPKRATEWGPKVVFKILAREGE